MLPFDPERKHLILADAVKATQCVEAHDAIKHGNSGHQVLSSVNQDIIKEGLLDVRAWLPFAAEQYNISSKLEDYVLIPVPIMHNDVPNRNGVGFPFTELTRFNPAAGMLSYKTWRGKPTFIEHDNKDYTRASGFIVDATMRALPQYHGDFHKVVLLLAFDRRRDPILANAILTKDRTCYSMGCLAADYTCSICGTSVNKGGCDHAQVNKPALRQYNGNQLAYLQVSNFMGFECSSVATPAFHQANNPDYMLVD